MCGERQPRMRIKRVTLVMEDGKEVGPVKIVGNISEVQTESGPVLEAEVYAKESVLPNSTPRIARFITVFTNLSHRKNGN